jgi:DNA-binding beta-propeller fold protein YncE
MLRWITALGASAAFLLVSGVAPLHADRRGLTLVVTMTNDPDLNLIQVYDAESHALLQTLSARGKGGVGGNARGVRQLNGDLVAVVNNGSGTVAMFQRDGDRLKFDRLVTTSSAPVSIDFANDHMYVAGATTVDSFTMHGRGVDWMDGSAALSLVGGGAPPARSTAQVGAISSRRLLVTLKADPDPGTVDVVPLRDGAITGAAPTAVSAPAGTLTPFGFSVYGDGTAVITLAHSDQDGLFRDGAFVSVVGAGQMAPCWTTRVGKYVFTANAGSATIGRLVGTGRHILVDDPAAAHLATGGSPTDLDGDDGLLGVIDHLSGQSHLTLFAYNKFGELTGSGPAIDLKTANANGVAIMAQGGDRE